MLFVGLKPVPFTVQTEGFMKQPVAVFHKGTTDRIVGLIPGTGQAAAVGQSGGKAILYGFCRMDIKKMSHHNPEWYGFRHHESESNGFCLQ